MVSCGSPLHVGPGAPQSRGAGEWLGDLRVYVEPGFLVGVGLESESFCLVGSLNNYTFCLVRLLGTAEVLRLYHLRLSIIIAMTAVIVRKDFICWVLTLPGSVLSAFGGFNLNTFLWGRK